MAKSNVWWPDVSDLSGAENAITYGCGAAVFVAAVTMIVALVAIYIHKPVLGIDGLGIIDAVLFAAIAFGIYKKSRAAAVAGLVLYFAERGYMVTKGSVTGSSIVMTVILILSFLSGVRGTFAYRKLTVQKPVTATST